MDLGVVGWLEEGFEGMGGEEAGEAGEEGIEEEFGDEEVVGLEIGGLQEEVEGFHGWLG